MTLLLTERGALSQTGPRWPLDVPPVLTSSFGEYRPNHQHAGIDLGTGGRSGAPCYAVEDGCVSRLRMSPFGYGKTVYLQLDSGRLVVYAHLSRFASPLAERARAEQRQRVRYTFDIQLPAREMRVRRGQIVAWSGQTGVGYPHLHFEVREGDVAVNPQKVGFAVPDARPPVLEAVTIVPLDAGSHVEGALQPRDVPLQSPRSPPKPAARRGGKSDAPARGGTTAPVSERAARAAPLRVGGRVGFEVKAYDTAVAGEWRQGPYRYELRVDGQTLYRAEQDRFDYADNALLVLDYDQQRLVETGQRFFQLFLQNGNRLPGREAPAGTAGLLSPPLPSRSWVHLRDAEGEKQPLFRFGRHDVEVAAADVAGHETVGRFQIFVSGAPEIHGLDVRPEGDRARFSFQISDPDLTMDASSTGVADSIDIDIVATRDLGASWNSIPFTVARQPLRFGGAYLQGSGELPWDGSSALVLRLRARDASGLEAVSTASPAPVRVSEAQLPLQVRTSWGRAWLEIAIESPALLQSAPHVTLRRDPESRSFLSLPGRDRIAVRMEQCGTTSYRAALALRDLNGGTDALQVEARTLDGRDATPRLPLRSRIVESGEAATVRDLDPRLQIDIPAGALFADAALRIEEWRPDPAELGPELSMAGPSLQVEPRGAAFDRPVRITMRAHLEDTISAGAAPGNGGIPADTGRATASGAPRPNSGGALGPAVPGRNPGTGSERAAGLFWMNRSGDFRLLSSERDASGAFVADTRFLSQFAVLADGTPPRIGELRVGPRGRRLRFHVVDRGADLGDGGIQAELDGQPAIPEWDPETGEVLVEPDAPLARGAHHLHVVATDQLGNRAEKTLLFKLP